jgi:antitoxin component YwqK of YwqJK toxin-antitoxin module
MKNYRSSVPKMTQERVVSTHESNGQKKKAEYVLNGEVVGVRWFDKDGEIEAETPLKSGLIHGTQYRFDKHFDGTLRVAFAEPYRSGLAHGTARQWDGETLIGAPTLWRVERE